MKTKPFDPISADNIDTVDDWTVEKRELLSGADEDPNWMALDPLLGSGLHSENSDDLEVETFIAGTLRYSISCIYNLINYSFS